MTSASIGGYRLVRRLGEGPRAVVFLGYPERDPDAVPVAVKVYRPGIPDASILAEAEALDRAGGPHAVRLLDAATGADGAPALMLERVPSGSLARVLRDREQVGAGEAITALAPLAHSLARLHAAGVAHGGLRAESVLFDTGGAPVLACFGSARVFEPGLSAAGLAREAAVAADATAFAALAGIVLDRVTSDRAVRSLLELRGATELEPSEWLRAWCEGLFDLAEPAPIEFGSREALVRTTPSRVATAEPVVEPVSGGLGLFPALALPHWVEQLLGRHEPQVRNALARARTLLRSVRPRVWVPAAAVAVAFVAAIALIPADNSRATTEKPGIPSPSASPTASRPAGGASGDDPAAAAVALLAERDRCVRELSVLCLDGVGQPGSAALAADQQLVRDLQAGGELPEPWLASLAQVTVIERLGDSALVSLGDVADSEPASLLLMQGEAGWRIRGYLER